MNNEKLLINLIEKNCKINISPEYDDNENISYISYRIYGKVFNIYINLEHIELNKTTYNYDKVLLNMAKNFIITELGKIKLNELIIHV
jgi:hypothetical protein